VFTRGNAGLVRVAVSGAAIAGSAARAARGRLWAIADTELFIFCRVAAMLITPEASAAAAAGVPVWTALLITLVVI
jgi:hypothetical protein